MIRKWYLIATRLVYGNELHSEKGSKTSNNQCDDGPLTILNLFIEFQVAILYILGVFRCMFSVIGGCLT